ncbi:hypothetical protein [Paenibacillus sp. UNC451MF]|nr:hypothetical protein [Paenibacillus sp. UNC451MF]
MQQGKWEQTIMYVKRNEQGVIIQAQEERPEDYPEEPAYRVIGD